MHLVCGVIGTLAVGVLGAMASWGQLFIQIKGVLICGAAAFSAALILFFVLKKTIGIRVSAQHEQEGLDSHEHGIRGYTIVYDD